jgi:hypothetical protein
MGPACQRSGPMVQVCTAMVLAMQPLMLAGAIRGFAEDLALVLAEVSVEAEAAAEADLVIGSRFKLTINSLGVNCRKDGYYAKRRWNRPARRGTWWRPRYGQRARSRPGQRSNGRPIRRRAGGKLCMPRLWPQRSPYRRAAVQSKKLP